MWHTSRAGIKLPNSAHESHPWRIHKIVSDFILEDVWALPARGGPQDFQKLIEVWASLDLTNARSLPLRFLWRIRDLLGKWFGIGRITVSARRNSAANKLPIPGANETSLINRLPDDLRNTADLEFGPFIPLYRTDTEFAAELSNKTVHAVLHLAWVHQDDGRYQGQMAVYVKPRGLFGKAYWAFIQPFRYWIVYPALMREIEQAWKNKLNG